jgi:P-type Ca2+ transporter type 2C
VGAPSIERSSSADLLVADAHAIEIDELLDRLGASSVEGLSEDEAAARLEKYGPNKLPDPPKDPAWKRLLAQFRDPLVLTLLVAAAVATVVGMSEGHAGDTFLQRYADAFAILLIVILNAVIGFVQESRAEAALEALQKLAAPLARVRRGGAPKEIAASGVVPGDLLELEAGDAVPADARLVQTLDFATEESSLTGESMPSGKNALDHVAKDAPLGDRSTMIYTGTIVVRGKGRAVAVATGVHTELGRIGAMMAGIGAQKTPLEERLDRFGKLILWICLSLSATLMAWGFLRPVVFGTEPRVWHVLLLEAVALAVAAIPEGLPAITTITLALGMQRMAHRGAIVRRLPAVETLGAATIICSDKTGTLTQNQMTVREVMTVGRRFDVDGEGYAPGGTISTKGQVVEAAAMPSALEHLLEVAALCNNARLEEGDDGWRVVGDPTEGALVALAAKGGLSPRSVREEQPVMHELPFDSDRQRMTVIARDRRGHDVAHVKGSIDALLPRSVAYEGDDGVVPLSDEVREEIVRAAEAMSAKALRVLAFCRHEEIERDGDPETIERELTFLGLVGMLDPPRAEVSEAVEICRAAGIRPVMITGDHKLTAQAIAAEIGMWDEGDRAITGAELAEMSDKELDREIMHLRVFARTTPEQKLRIVRAFKHQGHVVAMTGDGVNDAPALRESNIGVAMGKMGTDVARQAADLVLSDDNFATIVHAVREGRAIYRNIQKFIFFLLSANMGLVVAVFTVSFFEAWPALTPLMVLWINLVTNGAPALALGVDPPEHHLMEEPPRPQKSSLLGKREYFGIAFVGAIMGSCAVAIYALAGVIAVSLPQARALAFTLLALSPLIHAFNCRSSQRSIVTVRPFLSLPLLAAVAVSASIHLVAVLVPPLQPIFKTFEVSGTQWLLVLGLSLLVIPAMELFKAVSRARAHGPPQSSMPPSRVGW